MTAPTTTDTMDVGLYGTDITLRWIEDKLQTSLHTSATFGANLTTEQIGIGQGFASVILRLVPDWIGNNNKLPSAFVVKIPSTIATTKITSSDTFREQIKNVDSTIDTVDHFKGFADILVMAHASEVAFYQLITENKLNLKVPKCYFCKDFDDNRQFGVIILEDLTESARIKRLQNGLSLESIREIIEQLAILHSYSLKNSDWLANDKLKVSYSRIQDLSQLDSAPLVKSVINMLQKEDSNRFAPYVDDFNRLVDENLQGHFIDTLHERFGVPPVLIHGDLWMNNIMWKTCVDDGSSTTDQLVAVIDWQVSHPGTICEDLSRLLCSSCDAHIRRAHLDDLLDFYIDRLEFHLGTKPTFDRHSLRQIYDRLFIFSAFFALTLIGAFIAKYMRLDENEMDGDEAKQIVMRRAQALIEDMIEIDRNLSI